MGSQTAVTMIYYCGINARSDPKRRGRGRDRTLPEKPMRSVMFSRGARETSHIWEGQPKSTMERYLLAEIYPIHKSSMRSPQNLQHWRIGRSAAPPTVCCLLPAENGAFSAERLFWMHVCMPQWRSIHRSGAHTSALGLIC